MRWVHRLSAELTEQAEVIGGKAHGLAVLCRLGLPVPPGLVITTAACREFRRTGRLPSGLAAALAGVAPVVSVRSGGAVSMPGMMSTVLNVRRPELLAAVEAVFASWDSPRARTYRDLNGIPHDSGTAVTVQAMVFGDRDDHSGTGVVFSRDPNTGERVPFGEVLFRAQGPDVVSGGALPRPLTDLAGREPAVWRSLLAAVARVEAHYRDVCHLEFTYESGELWLLQVRRGGLSGRAAVRAAVDLADEGVLTREEALLRITPGVLHRARTPHLATTEVLARGTGASPGVATGRVATSSERAVQLAARGPVLLVRQETSPLDLRGLAAAAGVVTARGGPTSHAAVVARSMGKPAVVGVRTLSFADAAAILGTYHLPEGTVLTIDGSSGEVALGAPATVTAADDPHLPRLLEWADEVTGGPSDRPEADRLTAAHAVLRHG